MKSEQSKVSKHYSQRYGQSIIEIIIALAVFALISAAMTSMVAGSFTSLLKGGEFIRAEALVQQGAEAVRAVKDRAWNEIIYDQSAVSISGNQWDFDGEGTDETIGKFTRTISFSDICRNDSDNIVDCPGDYNDIYSKRVDLSVEWTSNPGVTNSIQRILYLTDWNSVFWTQTDWSGGSGQSLWSDATKYDSSSSVDVSGVGEIKLATVSGGGGDGSWQDAAGTLAIDTTDVDFNAGSFDGTQTSGSGNEGSVILAKNIQWAEHDDSGSDWQALYDVVLTSETSGWAVGEDAKFMSYDGTDWTEEYNFGWEGVNGLSLIADDDIWAVGDSEKIWHYDGSDWSQDSDTGWINWNDVDMLDADSGWVVGDSGTVAEYNGSTWSKTTVPSAQDIYCLEAFDFDNVWAGGDKGMFWRYSGELDWFEHDDSGSDWQALYDVVLTSETSGWAVGEDAKFMSYDGTDWTEEYNFGWEGVNGLSLIADDDIWAVGDSEKIWHYDGSDWSQDSDTGWINWNDVDMLDADSGWVVGDSGTVAEYNGSTWSKTTVPNSTDLYSITVVDSSSAWVGGRNGRIWYYNGSSWSLHTDTGNERWYAMEAVADDDIWAVGRKGAIAHYDGSAWDDSVSSPTSEDLNDLRILASDNIWATGENGVIIQYDGSSWSEDKDTGNEDWNGIYLFNENLGFVVGDDSEIFEYSLDPAWRMDTDTGNERWYAMEAVANDDIWAVGENGVIAHYDGSAWDDSVSSPTGEDLNDLHILSSDNIWATGENGVIIQYDGTSWTEITDTGSENWNGIFLLNENLGFVVGDGMGIYEYNNFYDSTGTFNSEVIDGGAGINTWDNIFWTENLSDGGDLTVATRSGNTASPDSSWSSWSGELSDFSGEDISSADSRYIQYRLTLTRGDNPSESPELEDLTVVYNAPTGEALNSLDFVSSDNIWAVGDSGTIINYNGNDWDSISSSVGDNLQGIDVVSGSDIWAVGSSGKILHYNGSSWSEHTDTGNENWTTVSFSSTTSGFAGGSSNNNMAEYDGSTWTEFSGPVSEDINEIFMLSDGTGWAVGDSGKILYYDGSSWSEDSDQGWQDILGIYMVSASEGWAVGESGQYWYYNGSSWSQYIRIDWDTWNSISMFDSDKGWVLGEADEARVWDGVSWEFQEIPTTQTINDVEAISGNDVWAVGESGTIIHLYSATSGYETSGDLVSSAFDMGNVSPVQVIEWDETVPSSCSISLEVATAPDSGGTPGTWTAWQSVTDSQGTLLPTTLNGNQWVRYKVSLSGDGTETPVLSEIRIDYK